VCRETVGTGTLPVGLYARGSVFKDDLKRKMLRRACRIIEAASERATEDEPPASLSMEPDADRPIST
jgi:hypothetical protein